jgi:uncharacterized protein YbjT (DUF2867 family)
MQILVLGASGQLGQAAVARLVGHGHQVRAFMRRPPAASPAPGVDVCLGDALDRGAVAGAAAAQDAVVNAIGSGTLRANTVESDTTAVVVEVLQRTGPRRYIGMSAGLVAPVGFVFDHVIRPLVFGNLYREHLAVERLVCNSDLDWTIVRPPRLTNGPCHGYVAATDVRLQRAAALSAPQAARRWPRRPDDVRLQGAFGMSRADVAAFIADELVQNKYVHRAVFLVPKRG